MMKDNSSAAAAAPFDRAAEPTMVERVARAICCPNGKCRGEEHDSRYVTQLPCDAMPMHADEARAAIKAMRLPTKAMLSPCNRILSHFEGEAGDRNVYFEERQAEEIWQKMIDAALARGDAS